MDINYEFIFHIMMEEEANATTHVEEHWRILAYRIDLEVELACPTPRLEIRVASQQSSKDYGSLMLYNDYFFNNPTYNPIPFQ
jgi:hypothetical protein